MPNRSMQAKFAKASVQRTEYAVQESLREASAAPREYQMIKGRLVPRPAPATLESLLADHSAKRAAQRDLARSTREALGKRTSFPWTR
jgi:hypothetical protein